MGATEEPTSIGLQSKSNAGTESAALTRNRGLGLLPGQHSGRSVQTEQHLAKK